MNTHLVTLAEAHSGRVLQVLRLEEGCSLDSDDDLRDALSESTFADVAVGLQLGVALCELQVFQHKRTCVVYDPGSDTILWVIRPTDFVLH